MVNRDGIPRIQEELDGQIRVFSLDDWNAELERRINSKPEVVEPAGNDTKENDTEKDGEENSLIQEDTEDDSEEIGKVEEDDDADSADRSL